MTKSDKVSILGSCFANSIGERLIAEGFDVCLNPFGTLYNPISIANSIARLDSGIPFRPEECVEMGANAGKICSWWHHTSFARVEAQDFLDNANAALAKASAAWKESNVAIITLGTARVWRLVSNGEVVSNCLKRPSREFSHDMLSVGQVSAVLGSIVRKHPEKEFIFTVSPIRHMGDGSHLNTISKATLHVALESVLGDRASYFPAYEILIDELRDYKYYAADGSHPSEEAVGIICERFMQTIR